MQTLRGILLGYHLRELTSLRTRACLFLVPGADCRAVRCAVTRLHFARPEFLSTHRPMSIACLIASQLIGWSRRQEKDRTPSMQFRQVQEIQYLCNRRSDPSKMCYTGSKALRYLTSRTWNFATSASVLPPFRRCVAWCIGQSVESVSPTM